MDDWIYIFKFCQRFLNKNANDRDIFRSMLKIILLLFSPVSLMLVMHSKHASFTSWCEPKTYVCILDDRHAFRVGKYWWYLQKLDKKFKHYEAFIKEAGAFSMLSTGGRCFRPPPWTGNTFDKGHLASRFQHGGESHRPLPASIRGTENPTRPGNM